MPRPDVAGAMLRSPKLSGPRCTVAAARAVLDDPHVHVVLVVDDGVLMAVVEPGDLDGAPGDAVAADLGSLEGRTTSADHDLAVVHAEMAASGQRRLAVVDGSRLVGLLCLKRSRRGFCSDSDVRERLS